MSHTHAAGGNHYLAGCPECQQLARVKGVSDQVRLSNRRASEKRIHGWTLEERQAFITAHGASCDICGSDGSDDGAGLAVDHDHTCCPALKSCSKCRRGLLCRRCNQGIGKFSDSSELLRSAADYIDSHKVG